MCNFDYLFICPSHHKSKCPSPKPFSSPHSCECILPTLQILNLSKNEKGIKFSIKLKFLISVPSYINCTLNSGKFPFSTKFQTKRINQLCHCLQHDRARFFNIDGYDSSVGQLGGYTSSLHALGRAFLL